MIQGAKACSHCLNEGNGGCDVSLGEAEVRKERRGELAERVKVLDNAVGLLVWCALVLVLGAVVSG